jgi:putative ABC transport system permease protein
MFQDLKYATRSPTRNAPSTIVIVSTLALAMGTSAVMFAVAETVLQSVPARDRDRVVSISTTDLQHGRPRLEVSVPEFVDWQSRSRSFDALGAMTFSTLNLTRVATPMRLRAIRASADFFPALGVLPASGRLFTADDDRAGSHRVALLTDEFWRRQFAGNPGAVGREMTLDGEAYTVVGILPASVSVGSLRQTDVWVPLAADPSRAARDRRLLYVLGRLKPGVTRAQSAAEMTTISRQLEREFPTSNAGIGIAVDPALEAFGGRGNVRFVVGLLLMMAALLVWIACANVANVILARAMGRRRELAIRSAIGASRLRLVRQLLIEDVVLSVLAGAAGLLLCAWEVDAVKAVAGRGTVILSDLAVNGNVLLFATALCLAAPIVFGLLPAIRASMPDLLDGLKDGTRTATAGPQGRRLRGILVACQVALAIALLAEVGVMVRATFALKNIEKGFSSRNVLTLRIDLPQATYAGERRVRDFLDALTSRIAELPGVQSAAAVNWLPIVNRERSVRFTIEGRAASDRGVGDLGADNALWAAVASVTPGYRRSMDIPLVEGRDLSSADSADAAPVVLVSRLAARRYWAGADPIGQHIHLQNADAGDRPAEVVGIVGDVWTGNRDVGVIPQIYVPAAQAPQRTMAIVVKSSGDAAALTAAIRDRVAALDKDQPIYDVETMDQLLEDDMVEMYIVVSLLMALAFIALGMAAAGIYGVIAYGVTQRTHEIGVRMALGAQSQTIQRMVVAQGLVPVVAGGVVGLALGFALVRVTSNAMSELTPHDSLTYVAVAGLVGTIALLASYLPARRATRIDPITALRAD